MEKKKLNFAYAVSNLPTYIQELDNRFIPEILGVIRTLDYVTIHSDVKGAGKELYLGTSTINFQDASVCTATFSGTTTYDKVTLNVCYISSAEKLCQNTLWDKYVSEYARKGQGGLDDSITFADYWFDEKVRKIAVELDKIFWQGDVVSGTGNLRVCDGVLARFEDVIGVTGSSPIATTFSGASFSAANVITTLQGFVANIPANLQDEALTMFVDPAIFGNLQLALFNGKYFDPNTFGAEQTYVLPFKPNVRVVSTIGLSGTNVVVLGVASYLHWGTDISPLDASLRAAYDIHSNSHIVRYQTKVGAAITFPNTFVVNIP
jgi:hypothetical protein